MRAGEGEVVVVVGIMGLRIEYVTCSLHIT